MPHPSPVVFFNVGSMKRYEGMSGDSIQGGGAWPTAHGHGHEAFNFLAHRGRYYGYVRRPHGGRINLKRLGAGPDETHIDGVTVVWVAKHGQRGLRVVGWYRDARVFAEGQPPPKGGERRLPGERDPVWHVAVAPRRGSRLLDVDERALAPRIPRNARGAMGQSNVWYADSAIGKKTAARVLQFIAAYEKGVRRPKPRPSAGPRRSPDPIHRLKVEQAAIRRVQAHYAQRGFTVRDVQKDNLGWDLEAKGQGEKLLLEVKGLSGSAAIVELTPNEFAMMGKHKKRYVLCIVTNALGRGSQLRRFRFEAGQWRDQDRDAGPLQLTQVIGARAFAP